MCFDRHSEVGSYNLAHPKGRKFTPSELKGHRGRWYQLVKEGKHFEVGKSLPNERVLLKADLKCVDPGGHLAVALELVNSGDCPLYIKEVSLGWHFLGEPKTTYSIVHFTSGEHWKCPLPVGMNREYQASIGPILFLRRTKSVDFDDVWISVVTPKGEIQRMVELQDLIVSSSMLLRHATMHGTGRHLYPT